MHILFQGDSITHAFRKPEEQNPAFQLGNGYALLIAARLTKDHPGASLRFTNRGVCGEDVQHLQARWKDDTLAYRPDLFSLLIGVNGVVNAMNGKPAPNPAEYEAIYRQLLDDLLCARPDARLVLMEPFLLAAGAVTPEWMERLRPRQEAVCKIAADYNALFIPLQSLFDDAPASAESCAWDGIHASLFGCQLIADAWLQAVRPTLSLPS